MSYIVIHKNGQPDKYIKSIDRVNKTLEFTANQSEALTKPCGFYIEAEIDYLKFHFKEQYPEIQYAKPSYELRNEDDDD